MVSAISVKQPSRSAYDGYVHVGKKETELDQQEQLEFAHCELLSEESGFSYLPGVTNLVLAPWAMYTDYKKIKAHKTVGDKEGHRTTHVRLGQNAAAFFGAVTMVGDYVNTFHEWYSKFGGDAGVQVLRFTPILSFILSVLEGILESIGLGRQTVFRFSDVMRFARFLEEHRTTVDKNPFQFLKALQNQIHLIEGSLKPEEKKHIENLLRIAQNSEQSSIKDIARQMQMLSSSLLIKSFAQKYIHKPNAGALIALERRVGIWTCKGLDKKMKSLAKALLTGGGKTTEARRDMHKIFKRLDEQALKKLFAHLLGILAVAFTIAAIVCPFTSGPTAGVIAALFVLGFLFSLSRFLVISGVYSQDGWRFSGIACLPDFLANRIDKQRDQHLTCSCHRHA